MEFLAETSAVLAVIAEQPEMAELVRMPRGGCLLAPLFFPSLGAWRRSFGDVPAKVTPTRPRARYVIVYALNHRGAIRTLNGGFAARARDLKQEVPEVRTR